MIRILIGLSDRQLGSELAWRLSESSDLLSIDMEGHGEYDYIIDDNTRDILPVSALLNRIIESYTEATGKPFYGPDRGLKKAFLFSSPCGGSGLSSVAFSFARVLCGRTGQKTLYADIGLSGRFCAGEYTEYARGTVSELEYIIKNSGLRYPMNYLSRDHFGPFVICMERDDPDLISSIAEAGGFGRLVVAGTSGEFDRFEEKITMAEINMKDVRSAGADIIPGQYDFIVHNRDYINSVSGNEITIADDPLSFKCIDGGLRISLSGEFGIGIDKLVKETAGDGGQGVFWEMS